MTTFTDAASVGGLRRTADGYLTGRVRCARTGVQVYRRGELSLPGDPMAEIAVYRPPEAVFSTDSLRTYGGKPIVLDHPPGGVVDSANWSKLSIGTVGSRVARDGETVMVDFAIMDAAAIQAIESGTREVSMGYRSPVVLKDGVTEDGTPYGAVQTGPIVINHLAVVPKARGGNSLRIGDAADSWGATPIHHHHQQESNMTTKTVVLGDSAITVPISDASQIEAFLAKLNKQIADAQTAASTKDEELGELKASLKLLQDSQLTPEKLSEAIASRVKLETAAKAICDSVEVDGVTDDDVRKSVVVAKLGDAAIEGASTAEINGMFRALSASLINDAARFAIGDSAHHINHSAGAWTPAIAQRAGVTLKKETK